MARWDGPEDPRIRFLSVPPASAEYWQCPGKLIAYADMLAWAATGKKPATCEHGSFGL